MNLVLRQRLVRIVPAGTAALVSLAAVGASQAAFTVPTEITDAATNVGLVGAAVFAIMVGIKLYKWLRRAL